LSVTVRNGGVIVRGGNPPLRAAPMLLAGAEPLPRNTFDDDKRGSLHTARQHLRAASAITAL
jgi:hypothetical protein